MGRIVCEWIEEGVKKISAVVLIHISSGALFYFLQLSYDQIRYPTHRILLPFPKTEINCSVGFCVRNRLDLDRVHPKLGI